MNDNPHPLRIAYVQAIRDAYHQWLNSTDRNPKLTESAAMKITRLGLSYNAYMDVSIRLCAPMASHFGWKYPYYNLVICDGTIAKVAKMVQYTSDLCTDDNDNLFEHELTYVTAYIDWWFGRGSRPHRNGVDTSQVRGEVAEYVCRLYGIPFISSNYNLICRALEHHGQ